MSVCMYNSPQPPFIHPFIISFAETLWNSIHANSYDDQRLLNHAVDRLNMTWDNHSKASIQNTIVNGVSSNGLRVTVLPFSYICRTSCSKIMAWEIARKELYVWHELTLKRGGIKEKAAITAHVWFLKSAMPVNALTGINWLTSITSPT